MGLYLYNGDLLVRDGALAAASACCCGYGECVWYRPGGPGEADQYGGEFRTYHYHDTVPPAPDFCDCPCSGGSCIAPFAWGPTTGCEGLDPCNDDSGACCGEELQCYVRSSDFVASPACQPRVTVLDGSTLDDWGTISGATETIDIADRCTYPPFSGIWGVPPPTGGRVFGNITLEPVVVDNGDGTKYLKLNIVAKNGIVCGPYGVQSLSVVWYFE